MRSFAAIAKTVSRAPRGVIHLSAAGPDHADSAAQRRPAGQAVMHELVGSDGFEGRFVGLVRALPITSRVGIRFPSKPTPVRQVLFGLPASPSPRQLSSETSLCTKIEKFIAYFNAIIKALPLAMAAKPVTAPANDSYNSAQM